MWDLLGKGRTLIFFKIREAHQMKHSNFWVGRDDNSGTRFAKGQNRPQIGLLQIFLKIGFDLKAAMNMPALSRS
jgi:hypothetical protein